MEFTQHILYDNWLYYKMETKEIKQMIENQDKIVNFIKFLGVTNEHVDYVYRKRDCLLFELHRRFLRNCMIQLYSVCKVRDWLPNVETNRRCNCCSHEYYEFTADLANIERGFLKCSETIKSLLITNAFDQGRVLTFTHTNFVPAIPSSSSSSSSIKSPSTCFPASSNCWENKVTTLLHPPRLSKSVSFASDRSKRQNHCLLERSQGKLIRSPPKNFSSPDLMRSSSAGLSFVEQIPHIFQEQFDLTLPFPKPKKRPVTFMIGDETIPYPYSKPKEDQPSTSTVDKVVNVNQPMEDKSDSP